MELKTKEGSSFKRIVIVANRLPFKITEKDGKKELFQNSGGLVSAVMSLSQKMHHKNKSSQKILWVGNSENTRDEFKEVDTATSTFDLYPVAIPAEINKNFYEGFCNDTIWPLFHYFPMLTVFKEKYYDDYVKANQLFMDVLRDIIQPDDFVWVHDYQLFLLPKLIRDVHPKANIGFFLHIPFPSYEVFRLLNRRWREEILQGLLGADLIGFHTNDYTQNFLQTVRRILGLDNSIRKIYAQERVIKTDAFPIGIDYFKFHDAVTSKKVRTEVQHLKRHIGDCKLIFSVDRLDYTKGIMNKLQGMETFLEKNPSWIGKIILNLVIVPSRDTIPRYQEMKRDIEGTVGRINGKFSYIGWRPIVYQYKSLSFDELVALYSISHVGLITPLRDGMNLVAKEYVACQGHNMGVLILSEFAGAVAELGEAVIVNPSDFNEVASAILKALEMSEKEKEARNKRMKNRIQNYDVFKWTEDFVNQLSLIKKDQIMFDIKLINPAIENKLLDDYKRASKRLILLDYDGTLVPFHQYPEKALPDINLYKQMKKLTKDSRNTIFIISGRDKRFLSNKFEDLHLSIIAEHGYFIKHRNSDWIQTMLNTDSSWKPLVLPILKRYTERCYGSFTEEKESALVWHYRNAEADFAFVRSQELKEELTEFLVHHKDLQLMEGNKIIEIKKTGHNKGSYIKQHLTNNSYDFILGIGDDTTDEDMFRALPESAYTIKVGLEPTNANYNLTHQHEVIQLIEKL